MRLLIYGTLVLSLLGVRLPHRVQAVAPHTFHTSLMRLEYNADEKLGQITLQVFAQDLASALQAENGGKAVNLEKDKDLPQRLQKYLATRLVIQNATGTPQPLTWIGSEQAADTVTLYLETPAPDGLTGYRIRNTILFEVADNQVNLINVVLPQGRVALSYERGDNAFKIITNPTEK